MRVLVAALAVLVALTVLVLPAAAPTSQAYPVPARLYMPMAFRNYSSSAATPLPTVTATPTPAPCAQSVQLLANPSFEEGGAFWVAVTGSPAIVSGIAVDGIRSVRLGGVNYAQDSIGQFVTVPTWAESAALYYSWLMFSDDSLTVWWDGLTVGVNDEFSAILASRTQWNTGLRGYWQPERVPVPNIAAYRGHRIHVVIVASTDAAYPTTFYVDKVWLVFACGPAVASLDVD